MHRIICTLVVLASPALVADDDVRKELEALQGKWKTVAGEAAGNPFQPEAIPDFSMVIGADGKSTGRTPGGEFGFTITVDPRKSPRTIDNRHETGEQTGKMQYGIYKREGDRLTVCVTPRGSPEADRPKEFATKETTNVVFVFERVREDKKP
jgi:uncharacterized protein (TIGR03067 family)